MKNDTTNGVQLLGPPVTANGKKKIRAIIDGGKDRYRYSGWEVIDGLAYYHFFVTENQAKEWLHQ